MWSCADGEEGEEIGCKADTVVVLDCEEGFQPLLGLCGIVKCWIGLVVGSSPSRPANERWPGLMQRISTRFSAFLNSSLSLSTSLMSEHSPSLKIYGPSGLRVFSSRNKVAALALNQPMM
jgi:hypothetical protein